MPRSIRRKIIIYVRPTTDHKAAIRDPQMHKALRQAGHAVSVIEDWALLEQALKSVPVDLVLVDVAEADQAASRLWRPSPAHPEALYVAFPSSRSRRQRSMCKLKVDGSGRSATSKKSRDTMKTRTKSTPRSPERQR